MTTIYQSHARAAKAAEKLKSYAQPQRLMILSRLLDGEHTVGDIEEATGIGQPALSQQLAELRRAALVQTRRVVKQVYYRLANEDVALCMRSIEAMFGGERDVAEGLGEALKERPKLRPPATHPAGAAVFAKIV